MVIPARMNIDADCPVRREHAIVWYSMAHVIGIFASAKHGGDVLVYLWTIPRIEYANPTPDHRV